MKKSRLLSVLLCLALLSGLLTTFASAADSGSAILDEMDVNAKAAVLVDPDTGEILYEKNAHAHNYPASITKVMTCLLTLEAVDRGELSLEQTVTASSALHTGIGEGASTADIKEGEQIRIIDLLYAALIPSANEACNVMAEAVSGDVASFVELMNTRAAELGMEDTHFSNTHGYHDDDHYTSALISNFRVAGYIYEYATGIKTGSTPEAGYCLAASATRENRNLISVVMGCEREPGTSGSEGYIYFDETIRLFKWGFANFSTQTILDNTKRDIPEVEVTLGKDAASVTLMPDGKLTALLPNDVSAENFTYDYTLETRSVEAPVEQGQVLGTITAYFNGKSYGTLDLVATCSVERDPWLYRLDRIQKFFDNLLVRILLVVILVVIAALLLRVVLFRGRGRTGRRGYAYSGRGRYTGSRRRRG